MNGRSIRLPASPTGRLLSRILEAPELIRTVQALPPESLRRLIDHIGLEDAGELIALATTEQLVDLFDADLWSNERPGTGELFDADRFAIWLEVMLEAGEKAVAEKLSELPESLVILAFGKQMLVLDMDQLAAEMAAQEESVVDLTDKALDSCLYLEISEYRAVARRPRGWDALASVLLALDESHHDFLMRILERCWRASAEYIADNGGLYRVLTSEEMLESDASAEREDRRSAKGFVAPLDAAAFLKLVRSADPATITASTPRDPITRAYFRELSRTPRAASSETAGGASVSSPAALQRMLEEAGVAEEKRPRLATRRKAGKSDPETAVLFKQAMAALAEQDPDRHARRMEELAYLANLLCAGAEIQGRRYRPIEAAEAVVAACERGLRRLLEREASKNDERTAEKRACDLLSRLGADLLFRAGKLGTA